MTGPLLDIKEIPDGEGRVFALYRGIRLTIIPGTGSTVTYSKVDSEDATAHDTATQDTTGVELTIEADWPFYRVSTAGGTARVAVV